MGEENETSMAEMKATMVQMAEMVQAMSNKIANLEKTSNAKNIEKLVQRASDKFGYHETAEELDNVSSRIPDKFSAKDLPIFKPMDDPRFHLKGFRATMSLKGIESSLLPKVFPLSLDPICLKDPWIWLI